MPFSTVELWLLDRARHSDLLTDLERHHQLLSQDEIGRAAAMADAQLARQWRCGRAAVRRLIQQRLGLNIDRVAFALSPGGRPGLPHDAFDFSLSDCGPHLLIGLSRRGRIGVDIERQRTLAMPPARLERLVAAAEGLALAKAEPPAPLQAWTRVEAFAKATAPTLGACLEAIGFSPRQPNPIPAERLADHARKVRDSSGCAVIDLDLPNGLSGALACAIDLADSAPRTVRELDKDMIRSLVT